MDYVHENDSVKNLVDLRGDNFLFKVVEVPVVMLKVRTMVDLSVVKNEINLVETEEKRFNENPYREETTTVIQNLIVVEITQQENGTTVVLSWVPQDLISLVLWV